MFSIRGLRLYFPTLEPWVTRLLRSPPFIPVYLCTNVGLQGATRRSACPVLCHSESGPLNLSVHECGAAGSASGQTACPVGPTLRQSQSQSQSPHSHASPLCPGCPSLPFLPVWMYVYFLSPWCWTSLPFDFLSVLVVRGGAVCLPTPPSWFSPFFHLAPFSGDFTCSFICDLSLISPFWLPLCVCFYVLGRSADSQSWRGGLMY